MRRGRAALACAAAFAAASVSAAAADVARYDVATIASRCPSFATLSANGREVSPRTCRVAESGVVGTVEGDTLRYAIYCIVPEDAPAGVGCSDGDYASRTFQRAAVAVFADAAEDVGVARLLFERADEIGLNFRRPPELHRVGERVVLVLPTHVFGTGNFNASEYWLRRDRDWVRIDSDSWLQALIAGLPEGLSIRKGVWPDLDTMQAAAALYREEDGNCCGTGGSVVVDLALDGDRFVLRNVTVLPPK